MKFTTHATELA